METEKEKKKGGMSVSGGSWMSGEGTDEKTALLVRGQFVPKVQSSTLPTPSCCSPSARLLP